MTTINQGPFDPHNIGRGGFLEFIPISAPPVCILRVNHFMIAVRRSGIKMSWLPKEIRAYVVEMLGKSQVEHDGYIYLTIDTAPIHPNQSQRVGGWHVDGFQGDEVLAKQPPDIHFTVSNILPTEFACQEFNMEGFDSSVHNLSRWVSPQVIEDQTDCALDGYAAKFNAYVVHRSPVSDKLITNRVFYRLTFTYTPVTSVKMTINPEMVYDYPIHTTSGEIPKHLI